MFEELRRTGKSVLIMVVAPEMFNRGPRGCEDGFDSREMDSR